MRVRLSYQPRSSSSSLICKTFWSVSGATSPVSSGISCSGFSMACGGRANSSVPRGAAAIGTGDFRASRAARPSGVALRASRARSISAGERCSPPSIFWNVEVGAAGECIGAACGSVRAASIAARRAERSGAAGRGGGELCRGASLKGRTGSVLR